jgi:hypothetical protein
MFKHDKAKIGQIYQVTEEFSAKWCKPGDKLLILADYDDEYYCYTCLWLINQYGIEIIQLDCAWLDLKLKAFKLINV